jgi:hypothetical protein
MLEILQGATLGADVVRGEVVGQSRYGREGNARDSGGVPRGRMGNKVEQARTR